MDGFSPEQEQHLMDAPLVVMKNIMGVDGAGFFNSVRESKAGMDFVREAMKVVPDNTLVQASGEYFLNLLANDSANIPDTPTLLAFFDEVSTIVALVSGHPDGEDYKAFLYTLAEQIASAAGTGFMGRGEKISVEEGAVLTELANRLGVSA